jgi:ABC-type transport system involved in multi-copper enzyme maturation permease subunit
LFPVAVHEVLVNLKSIRMLIMIIVLALIVVGGAYGIGRGTSGGGGLSLPPVMGWVHPALGPSGEHVAVVWVSDPFGTALADTTVTFTDISVQPATTLGSVSSDPDGFARLSVGNRTQIGVSIRVGNAEFGSGVFFGGPIANFTVETRQADLNNDNLDDDYGVHVLTRNGLPAAARLYLNDTFVKDVDGHGYGLLVLPLGPSNVTVQVAGENQTYGAFVFQRSVGGFVAQGPDFVLLVIASVFATFVIPIFAIVVTFDAVSKERVAGTLDLLLSRPASRIGTLLGKFVGTFAAVAIPVTLVNLAGIGVLAAVSGQAPTGGFAIAFLGLSLLLIAFYVPLQLIFSTLAKTSGTAILFGLLVWLAFNILYPVITLVLASLLFPNFQDQFHFTQVAGLGNPSSIYQQLVAFAAPESLRFSFGGGSILSLTAVATAAVVWFVGMLALAIWTFHRKAAE